MGPNLESWLDRVFLVMGGQMAGVGLLLMLVAGGYGRRTVTRSLAILLPVLTAGTTAVPMSVVNFSIGSDFRWALLTLVAVWAVALVCVVRSPAHD